MCVYSPLACILSEFTIIMSQFFRVAMFVIVDRKMFHTKFMVKFIMYHYSKFNIHTLNCSLFSTIRSKLIIPHDHLVVILDPSKT